MERKIKQIHVDVTYIKQRPVVLTLLVDCILDAVLTVSPKKQYLGTFIPTIPATAAPVWIPVHAQITILSSTVYRTSVVPVRISIPIREVKGSNFTFFVMLKATSQTA